MKKFFKGLLAALLVAGTLSTSFVATPASARNGGAVAAGVIGGLAAGAIVGGALAGRPAYTEPAPVYVEEVPACRVVRERYWDDYAGVWRVRRVRVCN